MKITRECIITKVVKTKEIPIQEEDYKRWMNGEGLIQHIAPYLSPSEREFILSGIDEETWNKNFKDDKNFVEGDDYPHDV